MRHGGTPAPLRRQIERANHDLHAWGWCGIAKSLAMARLILETRPRRVVEIGVYGGRSLIPQALALAHVGRGMLLGVDPWTNAAARSSAEGVQDQAWWGTVDLAGAKRACLEAIARFGVEGIVELMEVESTEAWARVAPGLDIVHIDGGHASGVAHADATAGLARVAPGGYLWLDDVDLPGVAGARDFLAAHCDCLGEFRNGDLGRYALFRKRNAVAP